MNVLLSSASVAFTCVVLAWAIKAINEIRAKDMYVEYFTKLTLNFIGNPEFNTNLKNFLASMSSTIQNRSVANRVVEFNLEDSDTRNKSKEFQKLMKIDDKTWDEQKSDLLVAVFYYLMALSYSSSRNGGKLRRRLRGELSDQKRMASEGAQAYEAIRAPIQSRWQFKVA